MKKLSPFSTALFFVLGLFFLSQDEYSFAKENKETESQKNEAELARTYRQLEIFSNVLSMLQENYVEEVNTPDLIDDAIEGLLFSLDPHSSYLRPEEFQEFQQETVGEFPGIGIEVTVKEDKITVVSPIADTPADKAGIKAGDIITAIEGEKTKQLGAYKAIEKLRGEVGSQVTITVIRKGWSEPRDFTITRATIPLHSVSGEMLFDGMLYCRIASFQSDTARDLRAFLNAIAEKEKIGGLILDLRNNPGGLLHQAVEVVDIFLNEGTIVSTKGRRADDNMLFAAHNNSRNADYPMVVLINEGSASASEIVAGAVQAHKRGILVGKRSFGKGSVQTVIPLQNGAGLRLTTAKYYTPDGRSIQALGIIPDVDVDFSEDAGDETDKQTAAVNEAALANHLIAGKKEEVNSGEKEKRQEELQKRLSSDSQLRAAYNILVSLILYNKQLHPDVE